MPKIKRKLYDPSIYDKKGSKTVFIGGIPLTITSGQVREYICRAIPKSLILHLEIITKSNKRKNDHELTMGFAFLTLNHKKHLRSVLNKRIVIENKVLDLKQAKISNDSSIKPKIDRNRVIITHIPEEVGDRELKRILAKAKINFERTYISYDYKNNRSKGNAIVDFALQEDAKRFLSMGTITYKALKLPILCYQDQKARNFTSNLQKSNLKENERNFEVRRKEFDPIYNGWKKWRNCHSEEFLRDIEYNHHQKNLKLNVVDEKTQNCILVKLRSRTSLDINFDLYGY